jgi:ligand-binding SRPBCC domain-containing protein
MLLMRGTAPARVRALDPAQVVLGERIFRSWVLLFGVIPIDYDDLTLIALEPGRGFHERSRMLSMRVWEHERTLEPAGDSATRVSDRLSFEPRLPGMGPLLERFIRATFRHRHRRLRRRFG